MRTRTALGFAVGLAACAALAFAVHGFMVTESCGRGYGRFSCAPGAYRYFIAIPVGALLTAAAATLLRSGLVPLGVLFAIGLGALVGGLQLPAGERLFPFTFGGMFAGISLAALIILAMPRLRRWRDARSMATDLLATSRAASDAGTGVPITPTDSTSYSYSHTSFGDSGKPPDDAGEFPPNIERLIATARQSNQNVYSFAISSPSGTQTGQSHDPVEILAKLNELREAGALSDADFSMLKAQILRQPPA
jgi:hypothetical protein